MGTLSIVATPIGNLEDITLRALRTLKECDVVYAEDTRVVSKLLARYEIQKPLQRLDAATEGKKLGEVAARLREDEHVVYVSDAGTPGVSDPGPRLVRHIREEVPEAKIESIAGPSALAAAIAVAGVPFTPFVFAGFLPHKKGRKTALEAIAADARTTVLFESPHRAGRLLAELQEYAPDRTVVVARELTKIHEEVVRGLPHEVLRDLESRGALRGEFVVIIEGRG